MGHDSNEKTEFRSQWILDSGILDSMKSIIDTHAHLCDPVFDADREVVLERALRAGISAVIAVGEDFADAEKNLLLASKHSMIRPAAGLYPTHLDPDMAVKMCAFIRSHKDRLAGHW